MTHDARGDSLWEDAGRRVASRLDDISSAVVVARDPRAAAFAALGMAKPQAARRRVAVGDMIGELEPLQSLVTDDDVHGIVDSFVYGVSLNRIARQVEGFPNLFILPSGSEPVAQEEVFRNKRWRRLSGGFQEVGALLLLVVRHDAAGLADLVRNTDGAIVVGSDVKLDPDVTILGNVTLPRRSAPLITPERGVPVRTTHGKPANVITPRRATPIPGALARGVVRPNRQWLLPVVGGAVVGLLLAAGAIARQRGAPARDSALAATPGNVASAPRDTADESGIPLIVANPKDSGAAAGWSVRVVAHNTQAGALNTVRELLQDAPALTFAPIVVAEGARWFQVYAGAFRTRAAADSLLIAMRDRGSLETGQGEVTERPLPLSIRLRAGLTPGQAATARTRYLAQGIPAYGLRQGDGTVTVYAGAFESETHAALAVPDIRSADPGGAAELAYRTGRP